MRQVVAAHHDSQHFRTRSRFFNCCMEHRLIRTVYFIRTLPRHLTSLERFVTDGTRSIKSSTLLLIICSRMSSSLKFLFLAGIKMRLYIFRLAPRGIAYVAAPFTVCVLNSLGCPFQLSRRAHKTPSLMTPSKVFRGLNLVVLLHYFTTSISFFFLFLLSRRKCWAIRVSTQPLLSSSFSYNATFIN